MYSLRNPVALATGFFASTSIDSDKGFEVDNKNFEAEDTYKWASGGEQGLLVFSFYSVLFLRIRLLVQLRWFDFLTEPALSLAALDLSSTCEQGLQ